MFGFATRTRKTTVAVSELVSGDLAEFGGIFRRVVSVEAAEAGRVMVEVEGRYPFKTVSTSKVRVIR